MNINVAQNSLQQHRWFVLNYLATVPSRKGGSAEDCVRRFNSREERDLEVFAPTFISYKEKNGRKEPVNTPLIYHYAFVRGGFDDVKKLCGQSNNFSFVLNKSSDSRYAVVEDLDMDSFRKVAVRYSNRVPFYSLEGVNLQDCDLVEVVEGDFPGLTGYFHPCKGGKTGRIIVKLTQHMATVAYDISARYVRVLEFSKNFKRGYDLIDAFVPRLYRAMRKYASSEPLSEKEISEISSFCRRMGRCRFDNHKIEAKLMAILAVANRIINDPEEEARAFERFEKRAHAVTSPTTKAFICLLEHVYDSDPFSLSLGRQYLTKALGKKSKALAELEAEYNYYQA